MALDTSRRLAAAAVTVLCLAPFAAFARPSGADAPETAPAAAAPDTGRAYVVAANDSAAGEYLTTVGGCNDCHSQGWDSSRGKLAAADRFTGNPVGYRGPWGTTYAPNLRLVTQRFAEDRWVDVLTTADHGDGKPPMPWMNTAQMSGRDLRAMYRYIKSLGPKGERTPRGLRPGVEPTTAYVNFTPVTPPRASAPASAPK